jgi:SAM-dependent methyltransferase
VVRMDDKAPTTPPPGPLPAAARDSSAQPGKEVAIEHDTTLKWIVNERGEVQPTPPPNLELKKERATPTLPPPARGTLAPVPAPKESARTESGPNGRVDLSSPKTPAPDVLPAAVSPVTLPGPATPPPKVTAASTSPLISVPGGQTPSTPPPLPARSVPPPSPNAAVATREEPTRRSTPAAELVGATPAALAMPDPTPRAPSTPVTEGVGAAPVAMLPGPSGSDSELAADAVEIIPAATEDVGAMPTQVSAPETNDTPREPVVPVQPRPAQAVPTEPHEVEPEVVVEMMESAEHPTPSARPPAPSPNRKPTPPPVASPRALTPPPVPMEAVSTTPPPVPPELMAAHAPPAPRLPEPPAATPPPVPPEALAAHANRATEPATATPPPVPPEVAAARAAQNARVPELAANLFEEFQTPAAAGENLPEALARRSLQKRSKPWYEEVFDEDYLRTLPFMTSEQTAREARFIREALQLPKGGEVLDVGCGYGRHALELAQQGLRVTGLDLSLPLLIRAADDAQRRALTVNFVHADMREMSFGNQFDGAYCVLSSFGYFDEETNLRVATAICRALKPGGRFLLDIINRDYIVSDLPSRVWWEGDACVVLEEVDFNYHTSRVLVRRSVAFGNGRQSEQEISMRAYSLHEVGKLLRQAGLRVLEISGGLATKSRFFGASSRNIIAVCERPSS